MKFSYEEFVECLIEGDQRIFSYKNMILIVENIVKESHFFVECKGLRIIKQSYASPELLLENAHVEGKSLQEIWDELILCD